MKLKTILLPLLMLAIMVSLASAEYVFPGNVSPQSLKEDLAAQALASYTNETAINESISDLAGYVPHLIAIAGGSAGAHTVTGVAVGDQLGGVLYVVNASPLNTVSDLMAEFTGTGKGITTTNTIANGGGTDTTGGFLIVSWVDKTLT
jgi:hypothetical protein